MQNFFTLLGLDITVLIDSDILDTHYLKMQQQYHPDNYKEGDIMKAAAQKMSAKLSKAYAALKNPVKRLEHILEINNLDTQTPPTQLLMQIMELREDMEQMSEDRLQAKKLELKGQEQQILQDANKAYVSKDYDELVKCYHLLNYYGKALQDTDQSEYI